MANITIQDKRVGNQFRPETVTHLYGNIVEKVVIEIDFELFPFAFATQNNGGITMGQAGFPTLSWIEENSGNNRFNEWSIGDTILVSNAITPANNGAAVIVDKQGGSLIKVNRTYINQTDGQVKIENTTVVNGIVFKTAFIENQEGTNFRSKETGQDEIWRLDLIDHTDTVFRPLIPDLPIEGQLGTIQIKGRNIGGEVSFTVRIETTIHPFYLFGQLSDQLSLIAPDYLLGSNSLTHVFDIVLRPDLSNPNRQFTVTVDDIIGNVGWFDENFNGNPNNYSIDSITYRKVSDLSQVSELILSGTESTEVTIRVKNTTDTPFSAANSQAAVSFWFLPQDALQYLFTGNDIRRNFFYDTAFSTEGAALVQGDQFGTTTQVITDFDINFIASDELEIVFIVQLGSDILSELIASDDRFYSIAVNVQDHTLTTQLSDKVQLLADTRELSYLLGDDSLFNYTNRFLEHPINDIDGAQSQNSFLPEDIIVSRTLIVFSRPDPLLSKLEEISVFLVAKKNSGEEFILESFSQPIPANDVFGGQYLSVTQPTQHKVPFDQIRHEIKVLRRVDLDAGTDFTYMIQYPWSFRWEDWIAKAGVNNDFFDNTLLNDGKNELWNRYSNLVDWQIVWRVKTDYSIRASVAEPFQQFSVINESTLNSRDYDESPDWQNNGITTFKLLGGALIGNILGYEDTRVFAEIEYTGAGSDPALLDLYFIMRIEVFQQGGRFDIYEFSSVYEMTTAEDTWWKSADASNKVIFTSPSAGVYRGEALIDFTKLAAVLGNIFFKISARIDFITSEDCLTTEAGVDLDLEGGADCLEIEN